MRSPLRTPPAELRQVIAEAVDEYMREVKRLQRIPMRAAVIHTCQAQGGPVLEGEALETHIDVLEALVTAAQDNPDHILKLIDELAWPPDGQLPSDQILLSLECRLVQATPPVIDDTILDQYHFEVTSRISAKCKSCRRGHYRTEQEFMHDRFLQRILIGHQVTCPYCHTDLIKVYGVRAVRDALDMASKSESGHQLGERKAHDE